MGRNLVGACALLIVVGLAFQSIHADDRKSAGLARERAEATLITQRQAIVAAQPEKVTTLAVTPFRARTQAVIDWPSVGNEENPKQAQRDKSLTLFHFNSKFGEVAVKPVIGRVTGAELSINF